MKNVVFGLQIMGLLMAFPLYMIAELNHDSTPLPRPAACSGMPAENQSVVSAMLTEKTVAIDSKLLVLNAVKL